MLVTDIKRTINKGNKEKEHEVSGFYMQRYLAQNLAPIPRYLNRAWDCVGIVSGHGKVRIGKSTLAIQVGCYIAWMLAGGEMEFETNTILKTPKEGSFHFNLDENVVFSAEELQDRALQLYNKYGKNQVIIYDEGRQGLDSSRAMESVNKGMEDFLQECGFMGHVIIIVLPNFFKLHEDYAVARSIFLIDVFAREGTERGYFNFYNEVQKEWLYFLGKKRIGVSGKYTVTHPNFWGRFTKWLPFDKEEYEKLKKVAIEKKQKSRRERNKILQRDFMFWLIRQETSITHKELIGKMRKVLGIGVSKETIIEGVQKIEDLVRRNAVVESL